MPLQTVNPGLQGGAYRQGVGRCIRGNTVQDSGAERETAPGEEYGIVLFNNDHLWQLPRVAKCQFF